MDYIKELDSWKVFRGPFDAEFVSQFVEIFNVETTPLSNPFKKRKNRTGKFQSRYTVSSKLKNIFKMNEIMESRIIGIRMKRERRVFENKDGKIWEEIIMSYSFESLKYFNP